MEVVFTNQIPVCPHCKVPTKRVFIQSTRTNVYYQPLYDEHGVNTNPDKNVIRTTYLCKKCEDYFTIIGNSVDGFAYEIPKTD